MQQDIRTICFLQDERFIRYVMDRDSVMELFWKNYLHDHPSLKPYFCKAREVLTEIIETTTIKPSNVTLNIKKGIEKQLLGVK